MNLNDLAAFQSLDSSGLLSKIQAIPSQLEAAYHSGLSELSSEVDYSSVRQILTVGLGEAVMGADLLAAYAADLLPIPWVIHRDEFLPAWAKGNETLIFVHPFGGVGREAGGLLAQSRQRGCQAIWLESPTPVRGVPPADASVGWYFGRLYAELERAGLLPALKVDLNEAVEAMQRSLAAVHTEVPVARNPAKRLAGQFYDRRVQLFAAGFLAPVARMWKMRINTFAKAGADVEIIPEADYNSLAGMDHPFGGIKDLMAVFLRASSLPARNLACLDLTRQICLQQGINTDFVEARGLSRLAQLWTMVLFGDMTAYYLAMAYGTDPGQNQMLGAFQAEMTNLDG